MRDRGQPSGLSRLLYRAPLLLYRLGLGWIMGKRFLRLTHTGRKSGLPRDTVLEVVDRDPGDNTFMVIAAWGERSDWYQNILLSPEVMVQVGTRRWHATAKSLDEASGRQALTRYAHAHPTAFRGLSKVLGYESEHTEVSVKLMADEMPVVTLRPRQSEPLKASG